MKKILFTMALLNISNIRADDGGQLVLDQDVEWTIEKDIKKYEGTSPYVQEQMDKDQAQSIWDKKGVNKKESDAAIMGSGLDKNIPQKSRVSDFNYEVLSRYEKNNSLVEANNSEILREVRSLGTSFFNFTYFKDNFDYKDRNNIYNRTFKEGVGAIQTGYLLFGLERYIFKSFIDMTWGGNFGLAFSTGRAVFIDGTKSDAKFHLYTVPIDLHLGLGLSLGPYIRLSGTAGPSAMGLYQNRSDFEKKEPGKHRRQISYGYFSAAKIQISLSGIFKTQSFKMFTDYRISRVFLNVEGRRQEYKNFQDRDFEISGTSLGVGLSFEYF